MKTLGILKADFVDADVRTDSGDFDEMFCNLFSKVDQFNFQIRVYELTLNCFPQAIAECDAYLITGSRFGAYEEVPWIVRLKEFIKNLHATKVKLIGICFGHQVIAAALGGKVVQSEQGWGMGVHEYGVSGNGLTTETSGFNLLCSHRDQVVVAPDSAEVYLSSSFCPNAGMVIGEHILTLQGHPEFSKDFVEHLCWARKEELGERFDTVMDSLADATDEEAVARLLISFLNDEVSAS